MRGSRTGGWDVTKTATASPATELPAREASFLE